MKTLTYFFDILCLLCRLYIYYSVVYCRKRGTVFCTGQDDEHGKHFCTGKYDGRLLNRIYGLEFFLVNINKQLKHKYKMITREIHIYDMNLCRSSVLVNA